MIGKEWIERFNAVLKEVFENIGCPMVPIQ